GAKLPLLLEVPDANRAVIAAGDEDFAIGSKSERVDDVLVALERADDFLTRHIPDANHAVVAGRGHRPAVRGEGGRVHPARRLQGRRGKQRVAEDVPHAEGAIAAGADDEFAVRSPCYRVDFRRVRVELLEGRHRFESEMQELPILAAGDDLLAVR